MKAIDSKSIRLVSKEYTRMPGFILLNSPDGGFPLLALGTGTESVSLFSFQKNGIGDEKKIKINGMGKFYQSLKSNQEFLLYYPHPLKTGDTNTIYLIRY